MLMQHIADATFTFCALAAFGLIGIGTLALVAPERLALSYGVATNDLAAFAFVRAAGVRDILIGVIIAGATYLHDILSLATLAILGFILSGADFIIAFAHARRFRSEQLAHAGGAIAFIVLFALLDLLLRR